MSILYYPHPNTTACTILVYLKTVVYALSAQDRNTLMYIPLHSGHELKLHPDDFQNFERQSYPIVIAWNHHNHFVPTCVMSDIQHNQWKLKELTILTEASLKVISDINPVKCTNAQRVHLEVLKDNMELSRTLFAPCTCGTSSAEETSTGARPRPNSTPLFTNVPDILGKSVIIMTLLPLQ